MQSSKFQPPSSNETNNRLIDQLVGCGTSVGANYCEANEAVSKKDFRHTAGRCVKRQRRRDTFCEWLLLPSRSLPKKLASYIAKRKSCY